MEILSVKNPIWSNDAHSLIDVTVTFSHLDGEVQFTASATDTTSYGPEIFERAISGEFGHIAPYVAPDNG